MPNFQELFPRDIPLLCFNHLCIMMHSFLFCQIHEMLFVLNTNTSIGTLTYYVGNP